MADVVNWFLSFVVAIPTVRNVGTDDAIVSRPQLWPFAAILDCLRKEFELFPTTMMRTSLARAMSQSLAALAVA
jgi:hypothetical protein